MGNNQYEINKNLVPFLFLVLGLIVLIIGIIDFKLTYINIGIVSILLTGSVLLGLFSATIYLGAYVHDMKIDPFKDLINRTHLLSLASIISGVLGIFIFKLNYEYSVVKNSHLNLSIGFYESIFGILLIVIGQLTALLLYYNLGTEPSGIPVRTEINQVVRKNLPSSTVINVTKDLLSSPEINEEKCSICGTIFEGKIMAFVCKGCKVNLCENCLKNKDKPCFRCGGKKWEKKGIKLS